MPSFISGANITDLCSELSKNSVIDPKLYEKYHVKKGLRNSDGTGVVAGITNICNVHGYVLNEGEVEDIPGQFIRYVSAILQKTVLNKRNPATVEIAGFFIGGEAGI